MVRPQRTTARRLTVAITLSVLIGCSNGHSAASTHLQPAVTRGASASPTPSATASSPRTTHSGPVAIQSTRRAAPPPGGADGLTVHLAQTGAFIVDVDPARLRFNLMPGAVEPSGTFRLPSSITAPLRPTVVAAFNGGFKFKDSHGGFSLGGIEAVPLVKGAASLVIFKNGTATVGQWQRDVSMSPDVDGVLQNLHLMVDAGAPTDVSDTDTHAWGSTFPKERVARVPRSGVCVTNGGEIRWVGGPALGAATLAQTMIEAGCIRGMELDINPKWVSFAIFDHPDPAHPDLLAGHNVYAAMHFPPDSYFSAKPRNWIMLTWRNG